MTAPIAVWLACNTANMGSLPTFLDFLPISNPYSFHFCRLDVFTLRNIYVNTYEHRQIQMDSQTDSQTNRTDKIIDSKTDRQTDLQLYRDPERQIQKDSDKQTDRDRERGKEKRTD